MFSISSGKENNIEAVFEKLIDSINKNDKNATFSLLINSGNIYAFNAMTEEQKDAEFDELRKNVTKFLQNPTTLTKSINEGDGFRDYTYVYNREDAVGIERMTFKLREYIDSSKIEFSKIADIFKTTASDEEIPIGTNGVRIIFN